jgi:hypothetical protein
VPLLLKLIDPAECGDNALAYASIDTFVVDYLEILVATGLFGSDEHSAPPISTTNIGTMEPISRRNSYIDCGYWHYVLAVHARNPPENAPETPETPPPQKATVENGLENVSVF